MKNHGLVCNLSHKKFLMRRQFNKHYVKCHIQLFENIVLSATMFMIGMAAGTPICGVQSGILGRKKTIMITQVVSFCGALCIRFADTAEVFYLGNFLSG